MRAYVSIVFFVLTGWTGCNPPPPAAASPAAGSTQAIDNSASANPTATVPGPGPSEADPNLFAALDWIGKDAITAEIVHPQRILKSPLWTKERPDFLFAEMAAAHQWDYRDMIQVVTVRNIHNALMPTRIFRFAKPVDGPAWLAKVFRIEEGAKHKQGSYFLNRNDNRSTAGWPVDDRTVIVGPRSDVTKLMNAKPTRSPLAERLRLNGVDKDLILAFVSERQVRGDGTPINLTAGDYLVRLKPALRGVISDELNLAVMPLAEGVTGVVFSIDTSREPFVECVADTKDPLSGKDLETLVAEVRPRVLTVLHKKNEPFIRNMPEYIRSEFTMRAEQAVNSLKFTSRESGMTASAAMPGRFADDLVRVLSVGRQTIPQRRLKTIGNAMYSYHDTFLTFPPTGQDRRLWGPDGKPHLSWRVALLPFLGREDLFKKFHLNEPWDSEHNIKLLGEMPEIYRSGDDPTKTSVMTVRGEGAVYDESGRGQLRIGDLRSDTILLVQAGPDKAVPWTKPEDLPLVLADPLSAMGQVGDSLFVFSTGSKDVRLTTTIPPEKLHALLTASGEDEVKATDFVKQ